VTVKRVAIRLLGTRSGHEEHQAPDRANDDRDRPATHYIPLFWRVFATNAVVLAAAAALTILVFSPGTLSTPVAVKEMAILAGALTAMLVVNLVLMRRALAPLEQLTTLTRRVDPYKPGQRIHVADERSEVGELARAFNGMLDRLEAERLESTRRALAAQESERLRVAQELHDEVGQSLTGVLLQLERARKIAGSEVTEEVGEAQETTRTSLDNVRRIAQRLRPEALDDLGLVAALTAFSERLGEQTGLRIERRLKRELPPLSYEEELVIYRIAQEALTNVVRHAGAGRAEMSLEQRPDQLTLRVSDDGRGLDGVDFEGGGVRGMQERALMIGAHLSIGAGPSGGAEVRLDVPLDER
jgi:two-component system, NarL family, sensor histidine kinase UhpB